MNENSTCEGLPVRHILTALLITLIVFPALAADPVNNSKTRIAVVSSYHPEYTWSQGTNKGVIAGLLKYGYLDNPEQGAVYTATNHVESSAAVIQKYWMDTKRNNSRLQIASKLKQIISALNNFEPDIVLLGDDNAANYLGNHYLDSETPVVFWGVNGSPMKYGLLDSIERPGHNVTGIYQVGYHREMVDFLVLLLPEVKNIALLSDDSPTGRAHAKQLLMLTDSLPVKIEKVVITNSYTEWQREALAVQDRVEAYFISTYQTLKDDQGNPVDAKEAVKWYLQNIRKPEIASVVTSVEDGMLANVNDSPFKQGYEAVKVAHGILAEGKAPAEIAVYSPQHGPFTVNRWRAKMLGIEQVLLKHSDVIDEMVDSHVSLD